MSLELLWLSLLNLLITAQFNTVESDIDSLQMQKQELVSFNRVAEVTTSKGYTYQNDATASTAGVQE